MLEKTTNLMMYWRSGANIKVIGVGGGGGNALTA